MNTGPENMRDLDLNAPLRLIEPPTFEKEPSHGDDCTEDLGDWTVMMVTMEDCEDQIMTNEPTLEQTNVQPHHPAQSWQYHSASHHRLGDVGQSLPRETLTTHTPTGTKR